MKSPTPIPLERRVQKTKTVTGEWFPAGLMIRVAIEWTDSQDPCRKMGNEVSSFLEITREEFAELITKLSE